MDSNSLSCSDEYLEDDLPDLVLDATYRRSSSCASLDEKGLLDLLTDHHYSLSTSHLEEAGPAIETSHSASFLLLDYYNDDSIHVDKNRVSYTDHSKLYVAPKKSRVYRSYLSLLPDEADSLSQPGGPLSKTPSGESFLENFKSLARNEQKTARKKMREDLLLTQMEIRRIRTELEDKVEEALKLKKQLGLSFSWKERMDYLRSLAKNAKANIASSILENYD